jgi:uncharacterized protein YaeQ
VVVVTYGGRAAETWGNKTGGAFSRLEKLRVIDIDGEFIEALAALVQRSMRSDAQPLSLRPTWRWPGRRSWSRPQAAPCQR